jgi:hypothetical protein
MPDENVVDLTTPEGRAAATAALAANNPLQVPDKFKNEDGSLNTDALLASYTELERRQAGVDPTPAPVAPQPDPAATAAQSSTVEATATAPTIDDLLRDPAPAATSAVDWDALKAEIATTGEVSAESLAAAEAAGVPKEAIAAAAAGWKAQAQAQFTRAAEIVGGEEKLKATIKWAKETYSADDIVKLQEAMRGSLGEQTLLGLSAAYDAANPKSPLIDTSKSPGGPTGSAPITPYADENEMFADMQKPEYKSDPAFRMHVTKRCGANAGIDPARFDTPRR